ncbi:MAG TPA: maltotransferase domain-containing protein [Alphaproteobacteria bacterium]|nr:maltotransferase domain-containing protein [Alphaproteobacteria bacterium]
MDDLRERTRAVSAESRLGPPRIYNLFPLLFRDFEHMAELLPHAASMGFDWVFLNPIHEPGLSGSLYAVKDPTSVSARLAGGPDRSLEEVLGTFCRKAAEHGLAVMLDLVVNHVAIDSILVHQHPEWIARDGCGEIIHPSAIDPEDSSRRTIWGDLAALDYGKPEARDALVNYWTEIVNRIARAGVRGFRCDAAYQVPVEIWQALIGRARRAQDDLVFSAETLGCRVEEVERLAPAGFDYLFNSSKWWDLKADWAIEQYNAFRHIAPSIAFPESHDTPRLTEDHPGLADPKALYLMRYALAAFFSTGVMIPIGYEWGFARRLHVVDTRPEHWEEKRFDISGEIARINALKAASPALSEEGPLRRIPLASGLKVLHRSSSDGRHHALFVVNPGETGSATIDRDVLADIVGVDTDRLVDRYGGDQSARFMLGPHEWRLLVSDSKERAAASAIRFGAPVAMPPDWSPEARLAIEEIYPELDGGRFPVKRIVGDHIVIWADIFCDGHDIVDARILYRPADEGNWRSARLRHYDNDRWTGGFIADRVGRWLYRVEAWTDPFQSIRRDLIAKRNAGQSISTEIAEIEELIAEAFAAAPEAERAALLDATRTGSEDDRVRRLLSGALAEAMERYGPRRDVTRYQHALEVVVDRPAARFASWYEIMPRSQGREPGKSATFADCVARLPDIAAMGFDVLYLLPIHPIGEVNRKGPDNSLVSKPGDPGSPYAIGSRLGGHTAIHPDLGTIEDFRRLVAAARGHGMEIALDFAIQCAPDHPWTREHPEWFKRRPDGTIKFAENPPKKYQDIVNVEFYGPHREALWRALADIVLYWAAEGVRIFRVDNPHTKPLPFWEWMIRETQAVHPDLIFLAEAFTRPKMMRRLAKVGFTMSYTYFTWRNTKPELTEYGRELAQSFAREYFRPNFFANTPDILSPFLQKGGPAAFRIRLGLAALMSGVYGLYNGFELCEAAAIPGTEDYLHSEKYQYKVWNWDRPGNIKPLIMRINQIRRENAALQDWTNLVFHDCEGDSAIYFSKTARDRSHTIVVAISVDPHDAVRTVLSWPFDGLGLAPRDVEVEDLLGGNNLRFSPRFTVNLTPEQPLLVLRLRHI